MTVGYIAAFHADAIPWVVVHVILLCRNLQFAGLHLFSRNVDKIPY